MKKEELMDAIGNIDGKFILEAEYQGRIRKKSRFHMSGYQSWTALAACLCILVAAGYAGSRFMQNQNTGFLTENAETDDFSMAVPEEGLQGVAPAIGMQDSEEDFASAKKLSEEILPRELDKVEAYLRTYPEDSESLALSGAYLNVLGENVSGQDKWDAFYANVQDEKPAQLVTAQCTVEGDTVLIYLNYDGNDFYVVEDDSRDKLSGQEVHYWERIFRYLKIYDVTLEGGEKGQSIMLVNDDALTYEELEAYWAENATEDIIGEERIESLQLAYLITD